MCCDIDGPRKLDKERRGEKRREEKREKAICMTLNR
jgi:hypothetical protein